MEKQFHRGWSILKRALNFVPVQLVPSPVYPVLHVHEYEPLLLVQLALLEQSWVPVAQSSISALRSKEISYKVARTPENRQILA